MLNKFIIFPFLFCTLFYLQISNADEITELTEKALKGDSDAQYYLGKHYYNGEIVEQNYAKAFYWIKQSALGGADDKDKAFKVEDAKGDADAQLRLGKMYALGEGVDGSYVLAEQWLTKAANSGSTDKQYDLAEYYLSGEYLPKDDSKAFYWHSRAAEDGDVDSQYIVATMYQGGVGTEKNDTLALKWFLRAADKGKKAAYYDLGKIYQQGLGVTKDNLKARQWYEKSLNSGEKDAKIQLDNLDGNNSKSITKDESEKLQGIDNTVDNNTSTESLENPKDIVQKEKQQFSENVEIITYLIDAEKGDAQAQYQLGKIYAQKNTSGDLIKAYKWLSLASKQGVIKSYKLKTQVMSQLSSKDLITAYKQVKNFHTSN